MDPASRQFLQDIQQIAGVPAMQDSCAVEDYPQAVEDPFSQNDSWFDDNDETTPPREVINIAEAARNLRMHM